MTTGINSEHFKNSLLIIFVKKKRNGLLVKVNNILLKFTKTLRDSFLKGKILDILKPEM